MRLFSPLLLMGLAVACPDGDAPTFLRRELASRPTKGKKQQQELLVPVVHENRDSLDWTYIPNYDYKCEEVGCCGLPDEVNPARQPCGPELWHFLNPDTSKRCKADGISKNQQSPIRIMTEGPEKMSFTPIVEKVGRGNGKHAHPVFVDKKCHGNVHFTKNTWEVDFKNDCPLSVSLFNRKWHLVQFHFHNAEHTINGVYMPLEVHMVHRAIAENATNSKNISAIDLTNDFLVLGTFLAPGKESPYFKALQATPGAEGKEMETRTVDPYDIIPKSRKYWHYEGSLTTPPCQVADGAKVQWVLFQEPAMLSLNQLGFFGSYFADIRKSYNGEVNRPIQPVNKHTKVYEYLGQGQMQADDEAVLSAKRLQAKKEKAKRAILS